MLGTYSGRWWWLEVSTGRTCFPGQWRPRPAGLGGHACSFWRGGSSQQPRQRSRPSTAVASQMLVSVEKTSSPRLASYDLTPLSSHWFRACIRYSSSVALLARKVAVTGLQSPGSPASRHFSPSRSGICAEPSSPGKPCYTFDGHRGRPGARSFFLQESRTVLIETCTVSKARLRMPLPHALSPQHIPKAGLTGWGRSLAHRCRKMSDGMPMSNAAGIGHALPSWAFRCISTRRRRYFKMRKFHKKKYKKKLMRIKKIPFVEMHKEKKTWKTYRETRMFYKEFRRGPPKKGARKLRLKRER